MDLFDTYLKVLFINDPACCVIQLLGETWYVCTFCEVCCVVLKIQVTNFGPHQQIHFSLQMWSGSFRCLLHSISSGLVLCECSEHLMPTELQCCRTYPAPDKRSWFIFQIREKWPSLSTLCIFLDDNLKPLDFFSSASCTDSPSFWAKSCPKKNYHSTSMKCYFLVCKSVACVILCGIFLFHSILLWLIWLSRLQVSDSLIILAKIFLPSSMFCFMVKVYQSLC